MLTRDETIARLATIFQITDDEYIEHGAYAAAFYLRGSVPKLDVAPLVEAVRAYESECANPVMDPVLKRKRREAMFAALTTIDAQERGV